MCSRVSDFWCFMRQCMVRLVHVYIEIVRSAGGRCATVFGRVSSISFPLSSYSVRERDLGFDFRFAKDSYRRPWFSHVIEVPRGNALEWWQMLGDVDQHKNQYSADVNSKKNCGACRSLGWLAGHMEDSHSHGHGQATGRRDSFCDSQAAKSSLWKWATPRRWPTHSLLLHNLFLPINSRVVKLMTTKWSTTNGKVQMNTVEE